jgi:hypothetical protein
VASPARTVVKILVSCTFGHRRSRLVIFGHNDRPAGQNVTRHTPLVTSLAPRKECPILVKNKNGKETVKKW